MVLGCRVHWDGPKRSLKQIVGGGYSCGMARVFSPEISSDWGSSIKLRCGFLDYGLCGWALKKGSSFQVSIFPNWCICRGLYVTSACGKCTCSELVWNSSGHGEHKEATPDLMCSSKDSAQWERRQKASNLRLGIRELRVTFTLLTLSPRVERLQVEDAEEAQVLLWAKGVKLFIFTGIMYILQEADARLLNPSTHCLSGLWRVYKCCPS